MVDAERREGLGGSFTSPPASDGPLPCVPRRFGTKCAGCAQGISPSDLVRKARGKVFHLNCFTCMVCNKQLSTGEELYVIDENKFVCKDDYLSSSSLKEGSLNSGMEACAHPGPGTLVPSYHASTASTARQAFCSSPVLARGSGKSGVGPADELAHASWPLPSSQFQANPPEILSPVIQPSASFRPGRAQLWY